MKKLLPAFLAIMTCLALDIAAGGPDARSTAENGKNQGENIQPPPPPPPPFPDERGRHRGGKFKGGLFSKLNEAEREEIRNLSRNGKFEELKKRIFQLAKKYRSPEDKKVDELSEKYLAAKNDSERASVKKELENAIRAQFAKRMEFTKRNIENTEAQLKAASERLEKLKKHYESNLAGSERVIQHILSVMCLPEAERKKLRPRGNGPPLFPPFGKNAKERKMERGQ